MINAKQIRPLWLQSDPTQVNAEMLCQKLVGWGYNALILSGTCPSNLGQLLTQQGLKLILQVEAPASYHALNKPQLSLPNADYIFWRSQMAHPDALKHPLAEDLTHAELLVREMQDIACSLSPTCGLIFYLPSANEVEANKHASWLHELSLHAPRNTLIAFSNIIGEPWHDHANSHPFWHIQSSGCPLLPIVNAGAIAQGEGLWPVLAFDYIDHAINRMDPKTFGGAIAITKTIPGGHGILDCNLWMVGHALLNPQPSSLLAETWFRSYHPELIYPKFHEALIDIRRCALALGRLRYAKQNPDLVRALADALVYQLRYWKLALTFEGSPLTFCLSDYFQYFYRDAVRLIIHTLQIQRLPIANLIAHGDPQPSFWTAIGQDSSIQVRNVPQSVPDDKAMCAIFKTERGGV